MGGLVPSWLAALESKESAARSRAGELRELIAGLSEALTLVETDRGGVTPAQALPTEADCGQQWDFQDLSKELGDENRVSFVYACTHDVKLAQLKPGGIIVEVG
ncbi:hypothetical protein OHA79_02735 [Streptomyces sp. NBC_00841]|uniref:hypothetical protein n=1 Tax=Streptomyces sp. NBC_00841 TaxID=2975847 RepID=UPI002DDB1FA5|nr:hypothetical protein [Streptomyces sp. NBC_00841]WRZ96937.1 hypothetical protein OHA79_02735 [Streptomyces sp. NBC_00841]